MQSHLSPIYNQSPQFFSQKTKWILNAYYINSCGITYGRLWINGSYESCNTKPYQATFNILKFTCGWWYQEKSGRHILQTFEMYLQILNNYIMTFFVI